MRRAQIVLVLLAAIISFSISPERLLSVKSEISVPENATNVDSDRRSMRNQSWTPRDAIVIESDEDFVTCECTAQGNGSTTSPYIIRDHSISTSWIGISISDTRAHFIIQNVEVKINVNSNRWPLTGFWMKNVENGAMVNNSVEGEGHGFFLRRSSNNVLTNNTADVSGPSGFYLELSAYNVLTSNSATNSGLGFFLYYSNANTLTNNTSNNNTGGIHLFESSHNNLTRNRAVDNTREGLYLVLSHKNTLLGNIAINNGVADFMEGYSTRNLLVDNYFPPILTLISSATVSNLSILETGIILFFTSFSVRKCGPRLLPKKKAILPIWK